MSDLWFVGHKVELEEMLHGREKRVRRQAMFLEEMAKQVSGANAAAPAGPVAMATPAAADKALICLTVNMPGPVKVCAASKIICAAALRAIKEIKGTSLLGLYADGYGQEAYISCQAGPIEIKKLTAQIEEVHPLGRLFDIDVIGADASKISREDIGMPGRRCLLCGRPAAECASTRAHSVDELRAAIEDMILSWGRGENKALASSENEDKTFSPVNPADVQNTAIPPLAYRLHRRDIISACAYGAMMAEVHTTPKPGLVDEESSGSHDDMDITSFEKSATALESYFGDCFEAGRMAITKSILSAALPQAGEAGGAKQSPLIELFSELRAYGITAEKDMYEAAGANTHKGLIFSLGFISAAAGVCAAQQARMAYLTGEDTDGCLEYDIDAILETAGLLASPARQEISARGSIGGARVEAADGFPSVRDIALPAYEEALDIGLSANDAGVYALINLIGGVEDTNMAARGGSETAQNMRRKAARIAGKFKAYAQSPDFDEDILQPSEDFIDEVRGLGDEFKKLHLSPGGCADLLAITYFLKMLEQF